MIETRCPWPGCGRRIATPEPLVGKPAVCDACGAVFTVRPERVWQRLERRETRIRAGDVAGGNPPFADEPRRWRRDFYHSAPASDPHHALVRDPIYEASVDRAAPAHPAVDIVGVLDDVRSRWNVGSIFRSADAAGLAALVLAGITPTPPATMIAKTALGAEETVPWRYSASAAEALHTAQQEGRQLWALELTRDAAPIFEVEPPPRLALVVGNEVSGVSAEALALCSRHVAIPMAGRKGSLNVAVAFGVAAFALSRAWRHRYAARDEA